MTAQPEIFRDRLLDSLLDLLWREWGALGIPSSRVEATTYVIDPEALLLLTCTIGRYDPRLFDLVLEWLLLNGRFVNIQRLRNIQRLEPFHNIIVLSAIADWLGGRGDGKKWKTLSVVQSHGEMSPIPASGKCEQRPGYSARESDTQYGGEPLFNLPDGRPLPVLHEPDPTFLRHGLLRTQVGNRGLVGPLNTASPATRLLRLRALFGVNARCDVLNFLALRGAGHPREIARELYFSQKAVHDVLADLEISGALVSAKQPRERIFRLASEGWKLIGEPDKKQGWVNRPILYASAVSVWDEVKNAVAAGVPPSPFPKAVRERLTGQRWLGKSFTPDREAGWHPWEEFLRVFSLTAAGEPDGP